MITALGSMGMGFMWGWLLILLGGRGPRKRPFINALALGLATVVFSAQLIWFADVRALIFFLATMTFSFILHLAWRHSLRIESPR